MAGMISQDVVELVLKHRLTNLCGYGCKCDLKIVELCYVALVCCYEELIIFQFYIKFVEVD